MKQLTTILPSSVKLVTWVAMMHISTTKVVADNLVTIRVKPTGGVVAIAKIKKGSIFPVISQNIQQCDKSELTTAAYHISETVHVIPRFSYEPKEGRDGHHFNPAVHIRIVEPGDKSDVLDKVNAKLRSQHTQ